MRRATFFSLLFVNLVSFELAFAQPFQVDLPNVPPPSATVYMSPTGNDANPGTMLAPVETFYQALDLLPYGANAGEHIYSEIVLLPGVYNVGSEGWKQSCGDYISAQGGYKDVSIRGTHRDDVILNGSTITNSDFILRLRGSHISIKSMTLTGSYNNLTSQDLIFSLSNEKCSNSPDEITDIIVDSIIAEGIWEHGLQISRVERLLVQNCIIRNNVIENQNNVSGWGGWASGLKARLCKHVTFRNNISEGNWGEGIILNRSSNVAAYGNVSKNNYAGNIYIDSGDSVMVHSNLTFNDLIASDHWRSGKAATSLQMGSEEYSSDPWNQLRAIYVYNNVFLNGGSGISMSTYRSNNWPIYYTDVYVINNTVAGIAALSSSTSSKRLLALDFDLIDPAKVIASNVNVQANVFSVSQQTIDSLQSFRVCSSQDIAPYSNMMDYGYNMWSLVPDINPGDYGPHDPATDVIRTSIPTSTDENNVDILIPDNNNDLVYSYPAPSFLTTDYNSVTRQNPTNVGAFEFESGLGVDKSTGDQFDGSFYPNPATDELMIVLNSTTVLPAELVLWSTQGVQLQTHTLTSNKAQISLADLPEGLYFIGIKTVDGVSRSSFRVIR